MLKYCKRLSVRTIWILAWTYLVFSSTNALSAEFNFSASTPSGSWAIREDLNTNHKGKQTISVTKYSVVGSEKVDGKSHVWIEMDTQSYKLKKKGKRKKMGGRSIFKVLIDADMFAKSPANVMSNLSKHASTIIVQVGKNDPMRIDQGGMLAESMLKAMGVQIEFDYAEGSTKKVEVAAGNFSCKEFSGEGSTTARLVIKKVKVNTQTTGCYSNKIPFGLIQAESNSTINGKKANNKVQLMEFGKSGAKTAITKEATAAPKMPKLF